MQKLKGRITISRHTDTDMESTIHITIDDRLSSCQAIDVTMSMLDFAKAVTGQGYIDCDFEFNDSGLVGMIREFKHVSVPRVDHMEMTTPNDSDIAKYMMKIPEIANLYSEHWHPRYDDFRNSHNWVADKKVEVLFERWVKCEDKDNA